MLSFFDNLVGRSVIFFYIYIPYINTKYLNKGLLAIQKGQGMLATQLRLNFSDFNF